MLVPQNFDHVFAQVYFSKISIENDLKILTSRANSTDPSISKSSYKIEIRKAILATNGLSNVNDENGWRELSELIANSTAKAMLPSIFGLYILFKNRFNWHKTKNELNIVTDTYAYLYARMPLEFAKSS